MNNEETSQPNLALTAVSLPLRFFGYFLKEKAYISIQTAPQFGLFNQFNPLGSWGLRLAQWSQRRALEAGKPRSIITSAIHGINRLTFDPKFSKAVQNQMKLRKLVKGYIKGGKDVTNLFDTGVLRFSDQLKSYFKVSDEVLKKATGTNVILKQFFVAPARGFRVQTQPMYHIGKLFQQYELQSFYGFLGQLAIGLGTQVYHGFKNLGVRYKYLQYQRHVQSNAMRLSTVGRQNVTAEEQMYLQQQFVQLGNVTNEQQMLRENPYQNYYYMGVNS